MTNQNFIFYTIYRVKKSNQKAQNYKQILKMNHKICYNNHINEKQFDSEDIMDITSLCFNDECIYNTTSHKNSLLCSVCLKQKNNKRVGENISKIKKHQKHENQVITLDSILKQLTRMVVEPQKLARDYLHRAATALHKFQVISEIKQKIQKVEEGLQTQILHFLEETQQLVNKCSQTKKDISKLIQNMVYIGNISELQLLASKLLNTLKINPMYLEDQTSSLKSISQKNKGYKIPKLLHKSINISKESIEGENINHLKDWEYSLKNINQCYQMYRDYAIKIVQICTVESSDEEDDFQTNLAASTKLYETLQKQVKKKVINSLSQNHETKHAKSTTELQHQVHSHFNRTQSQDDQSVDQWGKVRNNKPKNLNITLQTEFSYGSHTKSLEILQCDSLTRTKSRGKFRRNHAKDPSLLTPGKQITRLKRAFKARQKIKQKTIEHQDIQVKQFTEDLTGPRLSKINKQAKKRQQKRVMFEKILDIYQQNYQDQSSGIKKNSQK